MPSGLLQDWPTGSPVTLHTLASLMISISDNSATDMLLGIVGRENVERVMATIGVASAARNRPFPGTLEMFALKTAPEADQQAWVAADEAERRRLLETRYRRMEAQTIAPSIFTGPPLRIGELEWFASASDLVRTMVWLRRNGDDTARAILAISPGGPPTLRREFAYLGYKGGSEPGVLNQTWLIQNRAGAWYVVTVTWNNPDAPLDENRFFGLSGRALQLVR
jgi:beta-lactamase class A